MTTAGSSPGTPMILPTPERNVAVDAFRGLVMVLMMAEVLRLSRVAAAYPDSAILGFLAFHQSHVPWTWLSLHDLIQPSFSFLVGVALPYSFASRMKRTGSYTKLWLHAVWRAVILIALGIFLRSMGRDMTNYTFEDTLTQIGLGYPFLFLLANKSARTIWISFAVILFGYWLAWALYPVAGAGYDWQSVGVPADWTHHFTGFMAHWNKNANFGHAFDVWFLNLFPREAPFVANRGGYLTLSFIPTLGTMILGLVAGRWLRADAPAIPMRKLLLAGVGGLVLGAALHFAGINPVVKRIWTPAWTIYSGGWCFLMLAAFCWVIQVKRWRAWAFPLIVVGLNSIAAYMIAHLFEDFFASSFRTHLGQDVFTVFGAGFEPLVGGMAVLLAYWVVLYWMYKRKLFLRI